MRTRCSRARLPWWARATSSPASSLSRSARRSARRRLLTKIRVERWALTSSRSSGYIAGQIERVRDSPPASSARSSTGTGAPVPSSRMSSTGTMTCRSSCFAAPASTIVDRPRPPLGVLAAQEARDLRQRALRGREADALEPPAVVGDQALQPLEAERQVGAALGAGDGVDLVDDHGADAAQDVPPPRGQQQVEALRRGDQNVGRRAQHPLAVALRRVARADGHRDLGRRDARAARRPRRCPPAARAGCAPRRS